MTRARRRRTAVRVAGAAAAVLVVAGGSTLALGGGSEPRGVAPTRPAPEVTAVPAADTVPVVVQGHLRLVQDGELGPEGPAVAKVVGSTPEGVVVLTEEGVLQRVAGDGSVERLVPEDVQFAYLDGDAVVYTDTAGLTHWWGISPDAGAQRQRAGRGPGVRRGERVVRRGEPRRRRPRRCTPRTGSSRSRCPRTRPWRTAWASAATWSRCARRGALLRPRRPAAGHGRRRRPPGRPGPRRPRLRAAGPRPGPGGAGRPGHRRGPRGRGPSRNIDGRIDDLGWAPDGDLLVVVTNDTTSDLWRCDPDGTGCAVELRDRTRTLRLGQRP